MERIKPIVYRASEFEIRELWFDVVEAELYEFLRLIDVGSSALKSQVLQNMSKSNFKKYLCLRRIS